MSVSAAMADRKTFPPLKRPVFAYAHTQKQRDMLLDAGVAPEDLFTEGENAECLDAVIAASRREGGTLIMALEGHTLGETKAAVLTAQQKIEDAKVGIFDIMSWAFKSLTQLCTQALHAVASFGRIRGRRTARRLGSRGGIAKAEAQRAWRKATVADEIVWRLLEHLSLRDAAYVLGPPFSPATLYRHYKQ